MKSNTHMLGLILILIGILALVTQFLNISLFSMANLWPLFILIPGLCFELTYFRLKRDPGILVPGGILTTIGLLFLFETLTNWRFAVYTWPIYPLAVAIGLFQLYWFGGKDKGLLIPVGILAAVATWGWLGQFFMLLNHSLFVPIILIVLGLMIIFRRR